MSAELARRFFDAMNARDFDTGFSLLDDDVEIRTPRGTIHGIQAAQAMMDDEGQGGLENLDVELADRRLEEEGNDLVATSRRIFRWKATGEVAYEQDAKARVRVRDGKIVLLAFGPRADEP